MIAVCTDVAVALEPEQITVTRREPGSDQIIFTGPRELIKNINKWSENIQCVFRTRIDLVRSYAETYTITENLGRGSFGNVFATHCSDSDLPPLVAKFVTEEPEDRDHLSKLRGETATLRELDLYGDSVKYAQWQQQHPSIFIQYMRADAIADSSAKYRGTFQDGGWCLLHRYGPSLNLLDPDEYGRIDLALLACQMTDALHYLHQRHVTHGDIKPGNICTTRDRSGFVLIDLGEVRGYYTCNEHVEDMESMYRDRIYDRLTTNKKAYGTYAYCPVDQLFGTPSVLGDFESLGYVLLYMRNMRSGLPWLTWGPGPAYRADLKEFDKDRAFIAMVPYKLDACFGTGVDGLIRDKDPFQQALKPFMRIALRQDRFNYSNTVEGLAECERDYDALRYALAAGLGPLQPRDRKPLFVKAGDQLVPTTSAPRPASLPMPSRHPVSWPMNTCAPKPPKAAPCEPVLYYAVASIDDETHAKIDAWMSTKAGCRVSNRLHEAPKNSFVVLFLDGSCGGGNAVDDLRNYVEKTRAPHSLFLVGIAGKLANQAWRQEGMQYTDYQIGPDIETSELDEIFLVSAFSVISLFKKAC